MLDRFFSFSGRKKLLDAQRYLRRLIDLSVPNNVSRGQSERFENRHNRSLPTVVCPWENGQPCSGEAAIVLTKDVADRGIGLILQQPLRASQVVVGFCHAESDAPWFFLGTKRSDTDLGGGFHAIGVEITQFMTAESHPELAPLVPLARRLPPAGARAENLDSLQSLVGDLKQAVSHAT